jgi:hypothetical protein
MGMYNSVVHDFPTDLSRDRTGVPTSRTGAHPARPVPCGGAGQGRTHEENFRAST